MERKQAMRFIPSAIALLLFSAGIMFGQTENPSAPQPLAQSAGTISLEVPKGTPLPVLLDKEMRIRKEGQPIHGKVAEPIFAFDKLVVPAGSDITGRVTRIARVSA